MAAAVLLSTDAGRPAAVHARNAVAARSAPAIRSVAPEHSIRARIGFLQLHAPVFQFFERDGRASDRTAYESPGLDDAEIPVEVLDLRLPGHGRRSIKTIEHVRLLHNRCSKGISPWSTGVTDLRG